jgi:hypothetical protein
MIISIKILLYQFPNHNILLNQSLLLNYRIILKNLDNFLGDANILRRKQVNMHVNILRAILRRKKVNMLVKH